MYVCKAHSCCLCHLDYRSMSALEGVLCLCESEHCVFRHVVMTRSACLQVDLSTVCGNMYVV